MLARTGATGLMTPQRHVGRPNCDCTHVPPLQILVPPLQELPAPDWCVIEARKGLHDHYFLHNPPRYWYQGCTVLSYPTICPCDDHEGSGDNPTIPPA